MAQSIPDVATVVKDAKATFQKEFNQEANVVVFAPGRVNLIGEHIDYNDGFVMPMASIFFFIFWRRIETELKLSNLKSRKEAIFRVICCLLWLLVGICVLEFNDNYCSG